MNSPSSPPKPDADAVKAQRMRLFGIGLMCLSCVVFACLDVTAKYLGRQVDMLEVIWARYASAFMFALLVYNPVTRPGILRSERPWLQIVRSGLLLGSTLFNFVSFKYLQLDQAMAILFSTPLIVAALAGPMLGEWIGFKRWAAIGVGLLGVVLVAQPGFGSIHPAAILTAIAAFFLSFYNITTRILARHDPSETTLFYSNLIGALAMLPVMPFVWTTPSEPLHVFLMTTFGALASLGHFLLIVAYRHAPASVLSPFMYSQLLWAVMLGYLVFGDVPNRWTIIGAAIVIASGLYLVQRERIRVRR
jgi:drug/metabolite transporter (DMT)-like permease